MSDNCNFMKFSKVKKGRIHTKTIIPQKVKHFLGDYPLKYSLIFSFIIQIIIKFQNPFLKIFFKAFIPITS